MKEIIAYANYISMKSIKINTPTAIINHKYDSLYIMNELKINKV